MKFIITGGGTGGHVYPAISIANEIKQKYKNAEILFVGTNRGLEADVVPKAGYAFKAITVKGFRRKLSLDTLKTIGAMFKGFFQSGKIIKDFKPDVIVGTGGFVSGPVMIQGVFRGVKTVVHEQNAIPGVTVKILSRFVDKLCVSYEESIDYFKHKENIVVTGNPVRDAFSSLDARTCKTKLGIQHPCVLSVGGSGGAQSINDAAFELIKRYNGEALDLIHVTGKRYYSTFMERLSKENIHLSENIRVIEYAYNIPELMVAADMMMSRSGALILSEIALVGVPSLLIPSPNVAHNHQEFNAKVYEKNGAAIMVKESDISEDTLYKIVQEHLFNQEHLLMMRNNAKKLAKPNATSLIIETIESAMRG